MEKVIRKCPGCGKKFQISSAELRKKYKNGFVPVFCNYRCEMRFSGKF